MTARRAPLLPGVPARQVLAHFHLSKSTLYRLMRDGSLPRSAYYRIRNARCTRFLLPEVAKALIKRSDQDAYRTTRGPRKRRFAPAR